jgi:hypothetical protein
MFTSSTIKTFAVVLTLVSPIQIATRCSVLRGLFRHIDPPSNPGRHIDPPSNPGRHIDPPNKRNLEVQPLPPIDYYVPRNDDEEKIYLAAVQAVQLEIANASAGVSRLQLEQLAGEAAEKKRQELAAVGIYVSAGTTILIASAAVRAEGKRRNASYQ